MLRRASELEQSNVSSGNLLTLAVLVTAFSSPPAASAQVQEEPTQAHAEWVRANYTKSEHMVAMRDGVRLFTIVYAPLEPSRTDPLLLLRQPYSIRPYGRDEYRKVLGPSREFEREVYIFAFQDVRGKFKSEGEFEVIRPLASKPKGPGVSCPHQLGTGRPGDTPAHGPVAGRRPGCGH